MLNDDGRLSIEEIQEQDTNQLLLSIVRNQESMMDNMDNIADKQEKIDGRLESAEEVTKPMERIAEEVSEKFVSALGWAIIFGIIFLCAWLSQFTGIRLMRIFS